MRNSVIIAIILSAFTLTAMADVKIKARQTVSGQTTENTTYIKGKRQRTEQNMGGVSTVSITQCDLRRGLQLNPQAQVYLVNSWASDETAPATVKTTGNTTTETRKGGVLTTTITTKDLGETKKMFGYIAKHLVITIETESSPDACAQTRTKMVTDGWYIDAAFTLDCDYARYQGYTPANARGGCTDRHEFKQIGATKRGYPVIEKITMFDAGGKETFTMTNEVLELTNSTLDAALFEVPAGYREVKDSAQLYTAGTNTSVASVSNQPMTPSTKNASLNSTIQSKNATVPTVATPVNDKKPGIVRIGLAGVKTGAVGEGINAAELAGAVENSLGQYLKGTNVEIVRLEAKLPAAIESEAAEKQCDYVLYAQVSHKKGGGGFGMFSKMAPVLGNVVPLGGVGGVGGQVASTAIYTAAGAAGNIKAKDELTLEIQLKKSGSVALTKQFKAKAKSGGEDIISPIVEQAATALVEAAK